MQILSEPRAVSVAADSTDSTVAAGRAACGVARPAAPAPGVAYLFGAFRLIPSQQILLEGGARVPVGGRALNLLTALVERRGELLTKQELLARAWPRTVVEESNLKVHMAALRKALGEGPQEQRFVATVVGRGYQFVAPVERELLADAAPRGSAPERATHNLPAALVRPIGRAATLRELHERLARARLLTVAGPGGIGKTTVALALAQAIAGRGEHDVWFVDLSRLSEGRFVAHAVANAIGLAVHSDAILKALTNHCRLCSRPQLVVLDSCEQVIQAAAEIAAQLTAASPRMRVLATSREPLQAAGEHIYRLDPLDAPEDTACLTVNEALRYPAVELFVERASAARSDFVFQDDDAPVVARICRRLDGVALAIELAATRMNAFGVRELHDLLDDRFATLGQGRRTAPERQKTLLATLDWSHQMLPGIERVVLRRLGIFPGAFTLASALAIVCDGTLTHAGVIDALAGLVARSMVSANAAGGPLRYRLLDTTREYARRKLDDAGELDTVARRHACHCEALNARLEDDWHASSGGHGPDEPVCALDDVRAALNWAFSPRGDLGLAIALTVSAIPAWERLSSLDECRGRVEHALQAIEAGAPALDVQRVKLHTAFAASGLYTRGMVAQIEAAWGTALQVAERIDDKEYQLRALFAASCCLVYAGKYRAADQQLTKFRAIAQASGNAVALSDNRRVTAFAWHHLGRLTPARRNLERVLARQVAPRQRTQLSHHHVDARNGSRALLASLLWLQGLPERAVRTARQADADAQASGHALTLGYVQVFATIPVALFTGDIAAAHAAVVALQDNVARHGLVIFDATARCLEGAVRVEQNDPAALPMLADAIAQLDRDHIGLRYAMYAGLYARGLLRAGRKAEALAAIHLALARAHAHDEAWYVPELLRTKGEILASADDPAARAAARALFEQAIAQAHRLGARGFELRAATSLARLEAPLAACDEARPGTASTAGAVAGVADGAGLADADDAPRARLRALYAAFTEGFDTADLRAARALLELPGTRAGRGSRSSGRRA
ncbi:ATP-binding protein [Paraburkholderia acidisoli]|uniref:Transcriptional regulator n=1 Tax=Paraburkholderia acidisoli TaxID=2571748 RepID=A0A7Z2GKA5_9BURK|nr:winged helix-turn-helix domain-containing protein [Paraburkholderia acidisoli]QGZ63059.1 transcriptional regulator [Paraburkholderia acidisoli]